jgi:hypothetical protein
VVAVGLYTKENGNGIRWRHLMLPLATDPLHIGLDTVQHPFRPEHCMIQPDHDGLFLTVGEHKFVAPNTCELGPNSIANKKSEWNQQGFRVVPDANLLCRFAVGDATLDKVQAAAEALVQEETAVAKCAALEQRLAEANGNLAQMQVELNGKNRELEILTRIAFKARDFLLSTANFAKSGNKLLQKGRTLRRIVEYKTNQAEGLSHDLRPFAKYQGQ